MLVCLLLSAYRFLLTAYCTMARILERSWLLIVLVALALAGLALHQNGRLDPVQRALGDLFAPLETPLTAVGSSFTQSIDTVRRFGSLQTENAELREEVARLNIDNVRLTEAAAENTRLREALGFKQSNPTFELRGADVIDRASSSSTPGQGAQPTGKVISRDPSEYLSLLTINLGKQDGLREGMVVVTPQGVVGRIVRVGDRTARVLLITDTASAVNAVSMRTRATGVVQGAGNGRLLMRFIEQGADVKVGDIVLTSGLGGAFPKGQPIGQVVSVKQQDIDLFQEAEVRPIVDLRRLEEVVVLTRFDSTPIE